MTSEEIAELRAAAELANEDADETLQFERGEAFQFLWTPPTCLALLDAVEKLHEFKGRAELVCLQKDQNYIALTQELVGAKKSSEDWEDCALVTALERDQFKQELADAKAEIERLGKFACDYCDGHGEQWYPGEQTQDPRDADATGSVEQCDDCNGTGKA